MGNKIVISKVTKLNYPNLQEAVAKAAHTDKDYVKITKQFVENLFQAVENNLDNIPNPKGIKISHQRLEEQLIKRKNDKKEDNTKFLEHKKEVKQKMEEVKKLKDENQLKEKEAGG